VFKYANTLLHTQHTYKSGH